MIYLCKCSSSKLKAKRIKQRKYFTRSLLEHVSSSLTFVKMGQCPRLFVFFEMSGDDKSFSFDVSFSLGVDCCSLVGEVGILSNGLISSDSGFAKVTAAVVSFGATKVVVLPVSEIEFLKESFVLHIFCTTTVLCYLKVISLSTLMFWSQSRDSLNLECLCCLLAMAKGRILVKEITSERRVELD